jgi:hypothetical protein
MPCCLGAVDGKHCICQKPFKSGSRNRNYKDSFSTILMAIVDANFKFLFVDIGGHGSESDGGIFRKSALGKIKKIK